MELRVLASWLLIWVSAWTLDSRGNWAGDSSTPGLAVTTSAGTTEITHNVNAASEIESIDVGATNTAFTYDDAGNLTSDGTYDYEYDAWGRLVKVYAAGTSTWIVHFTYDGLGRLVRLQRPYSGFLNGQRIEHSWAQ